MAHKKVNTNDMLQLRRTFNPDVCMLCIEGGESVNHPFLRCSLTWGLWHRLFRLAKREWVPLRSSCDMMTIAYKGLGSSSRGLVLWQIACLALI